MSADFGYEGKDRSVATRILNQADVLNISLGDTSMPENDRNVPKMPATGKLRDIVYTYGESSFGNFIAAIDKNGLCAILFGDNKSDLLAELKDAFPTREFSEACPTYGGFLARVVAQVIERPSMAPVFPTSIDDGEFGQMVRSALRTTKIGAIITPEKIIEIGASSLAVDNAGKCAEKDLRSVAVPFHRMQNQDGSSPAYQRERRSPERIAGSLA